MRSDQLLNELFSFHPDVISLDLDRVWRLLEALGNPQDALPRVVHIAGTNGKGSTLAMIRAGLEAHGLRVNAYTSPHLVRFHERIYLGGQDISEDMLCTTLEHVIDVNDGHPITHFEATTCAALYAMAQAPSDVTLLEVGLGGRLDATNVIQAPEVCVITPVSKDHEAFLGTTLPEIAGEKAGIIKPKRPVVIGPQQENSQETIETVAKGHHAPTYSFGQEWSAGAEFGGMTFQDDTGLLQLPLPNLLGSHQISNAGIALMTLRVMGLLNETSARAAVTQARWPARMQKITSGPLKALAPDAQIWLDGGHNPAAAEMIADTLGTSNKSTTYAICGLLNTKDAAGYMRPLTRCVAHLYGVTIPNEANTLSGTSTTAAAQTAGLSATEIDTVAAAITAITQENANARILICGSLYLAGHVLRTYPPQ